MKFLKMRKFGKKPHCSQQISTRRCWLQSLLINLLEQAQRDAMDIEGHCDGVAEVGVMGSPSMALTAPA